ncbi:hypothetical protein AB8615_12265 [Litorimonas sp. RW-G-Af-16]|uniref:hypothetical protein n=1 Tax=Litorimonas sp. RW-G-Af-16 TaxID=3241168 RepID=UPI003AACD204
MADHPIIQISQATDPADVAAVKALFLEYLQFVERYLGQDLSFQGTDKEFADFPQIYDDLFLARVNGQPLAACAIKPLPNDMTGKICELKRLYARPEESGLGAGRGFIGRRD